MPAAAALTRPHIISRVLASLLGSYGFVWGFVVLGISSLVAAGMEYTQAYTLVMLVAFLLYLTLFCWAIAAASLTRVWLVLAGGGAVMTLLAWLITRQLAP